MLCEKIKEARTKCGLTQEQVREKVGVSQAAYSYFETGEKIPSVAVVRKLARVLGVSADFLLETDKGEE